MKILKLSSFLFLFVVTFFSCDNKDESKIVISLKSGHSSQFAKVGDKLLYELEVRSVYSTIKQFTIKSFDKENGEKSLFEINPDEAKYYQTFVYDVPEFSNDTVDIRLSMRAVDNENNSFNLVCEVIVTGGPMLLQELSGIVMCSGLAEKQNAFSLQDPSQVFNRALADSALIDIYDKPIMENTFISREWHTNTDVRFTKANNFNYAAATLTSIKSTYQSSISDKFIANIQTNDIILITKTNRLDVFGAIQITEIVDNEGTANDYYRFNIKISKSR